MKKLVAILSALCLLIAPAALAEGTIVVGATPAPHAEILELIKDTFEEMGYTLTIMEFTEYPLPNPALADGDLDANFFQHMPYMNAYNESAGPDDQVVALIPVHYEPFGLYAGRTASIEELAEGAVISVANDAANESRALFVLEAANLITLPEERTPESMFTVTDIIDNPLNLDIREIDAAQLPSTLDDVDMAVINGNYAIDAGFKPSEDALFLEPADSDTAQLYTNYVVVRDEDVDTEWTKDLQKALYIQPVYDYLMECGLVPAFTVE